MNDGPILIAIGTFAACIAILLILLRVSIAGRRPLLTLTRRWVAAGPQACTFVLAPLVAVIAMSFGSLPGTNVLPPPAALPTAGSTAIEDHPDVAALRAYAAGIDVPPHTSKPSDSTVLPGVDDMIAKLATRLKEDPRDAKGWKMLGWSYLNTGRPAEAVTAYEAALKLVPGDAEIASGLDAARAALPSADKSK
jgi:cytochrome c-type biogenesis protein CcmH